MVCRPLCGDVGRVAFRYKDQGIYQDVTWRDYRRLVSEFLAGFEALGLRRGRQRCGDGGSVLGIPDLRHGRAMRRRGLLRHLYDLLGQ